MGVGFKILSSLLGEDLGWGLEVTVPSPKEIAPQLSVRACWIQVVCPIVLFVPRVSIALIACFSSALLLFGFVPIKVQ